MLLWQFFVLANGQILKNLPSHLVTLIAIHWFSPQRLLGTKIMVYFLLFQALRKKKLIFDKIVFAIGEKKLFKIYVSNFNLTHLTYRILY